MPGLADLFPTSPFKGMLEHIEAVHRCIEGLEKLFTAVRQESQSDVETLAAEISISEAQADQVKKELRKTINKPLFLPVDRDELLSLLSSQDNLADVCQDIAQLYCLRAMHIPKGLEAHYDRLVEAILNAAKKAVETSRSLATLFEVGFRGPETDKLAAIIRDLEESEDRADKAGLHFTKAVLATEGSESPVAIMMWMRIIKVMGDLGNHSYKLSGRFKTLVD